MKFLIALIGDHDPTVIAHQAIPKALALAAQKTSIDIAYRWLPTDSIDPVRPSLSDFHAIWAVPNTPYRSLPGALAAIRHARESRLPFLGTCGGFQHALIEIARNVAGIPQADHGETNPTGAELVVTRLPSSLVDKSGDITFTPGSQLHQIFNRNRCTEGYRCAFGLNPAYQSRLEQTGLRFTGFDPDGAIRAAELPAHPFFIGTLFQPERSALRAVPHPLICAFLESSTT